MADVCYRPADWEPIGTLLRAAAVGVQAYVNELASILVGDDPESEATQVGVWVGGCVQQLQLC